MKIEIVKEKSGRPASELPANTIVAFYNESDSYRFIVPYSKHVHGIWLDSLGGHYGDDVPWQKSVYYNSTDYKVIGTFVVSFD